MTATQYALPMLLDEVEVLRVVRLSPSFARFELGGAGLAEFGVDGPTYDQRIKLVFPGVPGGPLPSFAGADESWYADWIARPVEERGHMRTYTVRGVRGSGRDTRLVVDIVLHADEGDAGPGASWAQDAKVGDRVVVLAPRRGHEYGGIEFQPGTASRLLLAGDETAVPAMCAVLEQLPARARGAAFLEVPLGSDVQTIRHPEGIEINWLPREGAVHGSLMHAAVLAHLGAGAAPAAEVDEVDPDLWETPTYSSSGEDVDSGISVVGHDLDDVYAWIAGESSAVTGLRRSLVKGLGMDRRQVAFMGYWRHGVAMQS